MGGLAIINGDWNKPGSIFLTYRQYEGGNGAFYIPLCYRSTSLAAKAVPSKFPVNSLISINSNSIYIWADKKYWGGQASSPTNNIINNPTKILIRSWTETCNEFWVEYVTITSSNNSVHLLPAKKNGVAGLYDMVHHKFHQIDGTTVE